MSVIYDDETSADAMQADYEDALAVDLEMAGMAWAAAAVDAARDAGLCAHTRAPRATSARRCTRSMRGCGRGS
jgi:hypothetical protein